MIAVHLFAPMLVFAAACATHHRAPLAVAAVVAEPTPVDEPAVVSSMTEREPEPVIQGGTAGDAVSIGLVAVEARLGRGELELAVVDLLDLARRFPADPRVRTRLARVLHQRALMRYGQGSIAGAVHDWERVVALDPGNAIAARLLAAARAESAGSMPPK